MKLDMWADITREAYATSFNFDSFPGYETIEKLGFEYTGAHGRGGGMGYDIWHEFWHQKYGTLCYLVYDVKTPLGFCGDWYLIPGRHWQEYDGVQAPPVTGACLGELLEYLKGIDEQSSESSGSGKQPE